MQKARNFGEILSLPNNHIPMKVDSKKKATSASIARGDPKMSPIYLEYSDQFVPNWNSIVIPVIIPITKLIVNNLPQKFAILRYVGFNVRAY
ncbi:Uncharacterised protein [Streptococcus pneumoniae]|nr:Uncharacterised protein [Streptococcus pneumoniae]CJA67302.1 Uncharacterised protein [Streptococcus pneumoniae]